MPATLDLTPDELLTTTRSVRRRLDLDRPVDRELVEECLRIAQQAPNASNLQPAAFVVVTDPHQRAALGELFRRGAASYTALPVAVTNVRFADPARQAQQDRIWASAERLIADIDRVPVHVVPCLRGRVDGAPAVLQAAMLASVIPAAWSFMLAARARGLGTCWTSFHLFHEREAADVLGIPYDEVQQVALIACAHARGRRFRPAPREPLDRVVHWDRWAAPAKAPLAASS